MTALAAARHTPQKGSHAVLDLLSVPVKANVKIFAGSLVVLDAGFAAPGRAAVGLIPLGRAEETVDNTGGAAGAKRVLVHAGTFPWGNSATTDEVKAADRGKLVYIADDQTVARTDASGARSVAGKVVEVDTDGVWVETGLVHADPVAIDIELPAGADLSAKQYFAVKVDTGQFVLAAAGEDAVGILQNAPVADATAVVRVFGKSTVIAGAQLAIGARIAADANGKAKAAVLGLTNTSDAGGAVDPLLGSHVLGIALTAAGADTSPFQALILNVGAFPTTAA
jgi:hypothetical protein